MAIKDYDKHFEGLADPGCVIETPNTVSRSLAVGDRSFQTAVWQSGKPILDSDLILGQDIKEWNQRMLQRWQVPSGWLRGAGHYDVRNDYTLGTAPVGISDNLPVGGDAAINAGDDTLINVVVLPKLEAVIAGMPLILEHTYTETAGYNLIALEAPSIYDGLPGTVKRTDFIFVEAWLALVAPSPAATGYVEIASNDDLAVDDQIIIDAIPLRAVAGAPGVDQFQIGATAVLTAENIATALNATANSFDGIVYARASEGVVYLTAITVGTAGNAITLSVVVATPGTMVASGATLTGGAARPSKPATAQDKLFRHGNVLSPENTWLDDELVDPTLRLESTQRVQLQYRIRCTGATEAVNYKTHPDGFSSRSGGLPTIKAQGGGDAVVDEYPFIPADGTGTWVDSSAAAYGLVDNGLWIAGDGTTTAAEALGALDGYVYAIPIGFVHRHNNCSDETAALQGFDPQTNTNGGPTYLHAEFTGQLGVVPVLASDRPDGNFCDVIVGSNILDLRRHAVMTGLDTASELNYQIQSLLDGSLKTWSIDTASKQELGDGSGDVSVQYLICDEVGRSTAHNGNGTTSGTTTRGEFIREFDHLARRFADQSVVERVVISFWPGDRAEGPVVAPGTVNLGKYVTKVGGESTTTWYEGDVLHLDLTNLDSSTLGTIFDGRDGAGPTYGGGLAISEVLPEGAVITDVLSAYHDDGNFNAAIAQTVQMGVIQGLGTLHLQVALDANDLGATGGIDVASYKLVESATGEDGSPRRIFLEVEITYPIGSGTTDHPDLELTPTAAFYDGSGTTGQVPGPGPVIEDDADQRPNDLNALLAPRFREGYREVGLEYIPNDTILHTVPSKRPNEKVGSNPDTVTYATLVSRDIRTLYLPRRFWGNATVANNPTVTDTVAAAPVAVDDALSEYGSSSRLLKLDANLSAAQTLCEVEYYPQDPIPNYGALGGGFQLSVYYRSNSPQTAGVKEGTIGTGETGVIPTTLNIEPLALGSVLWTGQVSSGSVDQAYPYGQPLDQIPINDGDSPVIREWYFCATANISIDDFNAETGLLSMHPFTPPDGQSLFQFGGTDNARKPRKDAEFRAYYPFAADWVYRPTVLSQPLYGSVRHKVIYPMLVRITEEVTGTDGGLLFRKDEVALMVLTRFAELDEDNDVRFTDADNTTCAALYRSRNLLMVVGDKTTAVPAES